MKSNLSAVGTLFPIFVATFLGGYTISYTLQLNKVILALLAGGLMLALLSGVLLIIIWPTAQPREIKEKPGNVLLVEPVTSKAQIYEAEYVDNKPMSWLTLSRLLTKDN